MESWPVVLVVLVLIGLAWYIWVNCTEARARSQAMSLQSDIWKVINQIMRQREQRPRDVTAAWFAEYEAFFKEHGGIPSYSPDDERVDWEKCRDVLMEAYKRLLDFSIRLVEEMASVEKARRDNPANLRRLESLIEELRQRPNLSSRDKAIIAGTTLVNCDSAKTLMQKGSAEDILAAAKYIDGGLSAIQAHIGPTDLP